MRALLPFMLAATSAVAEDRAVVIGIDAYPAISDSAVLQSAVTDSNAFANLLRSDWGFAQDAVTVLHNEDATSSNILTALIDRLVGETAPGDRVVLYFAGMGSQIANRDGSQTRVLLAHDSGSLLGKIPEDAIADILDIITDRDVAVIIDAGFDGDGSPNTRGARAEGQLPTQGTLPFASGAIPRTIFTAAGPGQYAWEGRDGGVFTQAMLRGLRGAADANANGTTTNAELITYLRAESDAFCKSDPNCITTDLGLTPDFAGDVQDVLGYVAPEAEPISQPLPGPVIAAEDGKSPGYVETLGFVTDLFIPSNDAQLSLKINDGGDLRVGDVVTFGVNSDRDGTLVLFDVNPDGELAQIFPSVLAPASGSAISAGGTVTIPNGLSANGAPLQVRVTEPSGDGFLLGLLIEDDLPDLNAILPQNLAGGPVPNAGQYLYEIAQDLLKLQASGQTSTSVNWSATYLPYTIKP